MKNIVITGAGRGIGLALTKEFCRLGHRVLATYRSEGSAAGLLKFAREAEVIAVTADVTQPASFGPLKERLHAWGEVDILVNNAGVIGENSSSLTELDPEKIKKVFDVNTFGPMRMCQVIMPSMKKNGTIAQISSLMGSISDNSAGGYYDYRMSKAALNMFNSCLSREFSRLTCLVLHPGWVQTDMGGNNAPVKKEESAAGLARVILDAKLEQSGQFFDYAGKKLDW